MKIVLLHLAFISFFRHPDAFASQRPSLVTKFAEFVEKFPLMIKLIELFISPFCMHALGRCGARAEIAIIIYNHKC